MVWIANDPPTDDEDMNTQLPPSDENAQPSPAAGEVDCARALTLVPAYTIGATDADETRLVEMALFRCPSVLAEIRLYRSVNKAILHSAPPETPPLSLRERILRAIEETPAVKPSRAKDRRILGLPPGWLAAVAAAAILLVSNVFWFAQVNGVRQDQAQVVAALQQQNDLLFTLSGGNAVRVEMFSPDYGGDYPNATVVYDPQTRYAVLYTDHLPELTPDQAYQLWLLQGEDRESAGVFQISNDGTGRLVFHASQPFEQYTAFGISVEPAAGSDFPTTPPVAVVRF
ncbi:MAG: anti-sigma factor [Anaerolineae bacterium]|nr:anti-sigma factor [Anaerolineae bacterium]